MSRHMRTTVRLPDPLMLQVKKEAQRRGKTVTSLIEQGLRLVLAQPDKPAPRKWVSLPVSDATGGLLPGVDLNNSAALWDILDDDEKP
jgi:hypothetical protein